MTTRSLVLLSGGIDSAVALWWALRRGDDVHALSFNYHDRAKNEIEATRALARAAGVPLRVLDVPFLREARDLPRGKGVNPLLHDAPEGYVPARNLVFYSIAANVAETVAACTIVGGHHGEDALLFPDASASFFEVFEDAARRGVWSYQRAPFRVALPLQDLDKTGVVRLGLELEVPMHLTWSCYGTGQTSCGRCRSCAERRAAFERLGADDPIPYDAVT